MAKLYFYYSSMNAGKSTTLLQSDFNYRERGMDTMLWTAAVDTRYGRGRIASRIGLEAQAHLFEAETDLFAAVAQRHADAPLSCVLVDEAQFLTRNQVWQLAAVADTLSVPVLCYGLRTDFQGALFPGSAALLGIADALVIHQSFCYGPTAVYFANQVVRRYADIVEKHFAEFFIVGDGFDRPDGYAVGGQIDQDHANAGLFAWRVLVGADKRVHPMRMMRPSGPDLTSVDHKIIAIEIRTGP